MQNRLRATVLVAALITAGAALGQSAAATPTPSTSGKLTFEVASLRPAAPIDQAVILAGLREGKRPEFLRIEGSRATFTYMSLKELLAYAYKVRSYQVSGPDWMVTDRFDITAKLPDGATRDDVPDMVQALLVERLKVAAHLETKEHPVLGLVVGKQGPKLTSAPVPAAVDPDSPLQPGESKIDSIDGPIRLVRNPDGTTTYNMGARGKFTLRVDGETGTMHLAGSGMTLKGFAYMLTALGGGGRQVVDMTGLTGNYDLAVDFSLSDLVSSLRDQGIDIPVRPGDGNAGASDPSGDSTISQALAKLGLRLEKTKAMVEQLVVDHVEKTPSEN